MNGKKVLVFGSGISGIGAVHLLENRGASVILYDGNAALEPEGIRKKLGDHSRAEIILGSLPEEAFKELDLAVLSPGVPLDIPVVQKLRDYQISIIGEVELAYTYGKGDLIAITGTNGKTTTTALVGEIMRRYKESVYVVGNIGTPYTTAASEMTADTVTVAEVSSFQLETIQTFQPHVSAILNITEDHLDRHHTMGAYIAAKEAIAVNQSERDVCVLNYEDPLTREFGRSIKPDVLYFSSQRKLKRGVYLDQGSIIYKDGGEIRICGLDELNLLGVHNYENIMAAVAITAAYGVPIEIIRTGVKEFKGVAHRIEYVGEKSGVNYYNDSKATNPDAAIKGIQAMNRPTVLIGGGYDKSSDYRDWIQAFDGKVTYLVLLGQTKEAIARTAAECGFDRIIMVDTLEEAVLKSSQLAKAGEAVLLSPACASWGMSKNFEVRGDKFKEFVKSL